MSYAVLILPIASRQLAQLPQADYTAVRDRIRELAAEPLPAESLEIPGRDGRRARVGAYRVIYDVDAGARRVTVLEVGRRSDA
jgi:mRNA interferase RelE/StbE